MNRSALILGTGAMATLFAAKMAHAGVQVTMLGAWAEGLQALVESGAILDGHANPVKVARSALECRGARNALVLVKTWQTERAGRDLAACLHLEGMAVTLQNGLGNDAILARWLGAERVAVGVTTLGATLLAPGQAVSRGEGAVTLQDTPRLNPLAGMLESAGFDVQRVMDGRSLMWGKLAVNAAINPLTALLRVPNGDLLKIPSARRLMRFLALEASEVAAALKIPLTDPDLAALAEQVAVRTAGNTSSMLQDVLRGAPTEVDAINGAIVREAERMGIAVPVNRAILHLVHSMRGK